MKNAVVQLVLVLIGVTSVHAVKLLQNASIHTRIFPASDAGQVWAIHGKDSLKMTDNEDGEYYSPTVIPGYWQIRIEARAPYRDTIIRAVSITPGMNKDLGEIHLVK